MPRRVSRLDVSTMPATRLNLRSAVYITNQKALFSHGYITALAATAGYNVSVDAIDDDSVDCMLKSREPGRGRIEIQLKATSSVPAPGAAAHFPFSLALKNYEDLRLLPADFLIPRMLVVLLLPTNLADWLTHSTTETTLRHAAYFRNLSGFPPINTNTTTIHIPWQNQLTVSSLTSLMLHVRANGVLP